MIRTVLFAVMLALGVLAVTIPAVPAHAGDKKGFFSFFNRAQNDGSTGGGPVHMEPGTSGAAGNSDIKVFGFGKNSAAKMVKYEDSPINAERAAAAKKFAAWNANELAKARASTAALVEQVEAKIQYNKQLGRQKQAQKMAQNGKDITAGVASAQGNPLVLQAMRESARMQALRGQQTGTVVPPPSTMPKAAPVTAEAPKIEKPKRERKPQSLFNRITE